MRFLDLMGYPAPTPLPVDVVVDLCLAMSAGAIRDAERAPTKRNGAIPAIYNTITPF